MTVGALAVAESEPALAADLITRAVNTVPISMHEYAPDGAYPEGPGYWGYGTSFNVVLISALESVLGTDFGLAALPGFLATADYYLHVVGPSGFYFNYSDAGRGGQGTSPAMFWFAARRHEPYLLWNQWPALEAGAEARGGARARDRLAPLLMLWLAVRIIRHRRRRPRCRGPAADPNPVAFHRSAWDRDATFVAFKAGSASLNHAHMDVGTFVMDALGVRWADDLGSQDYNSLESKGVDLWNRAPTSDRWKVFRIGASSHNILTGGRPAAGRRAGRPRSRWRRPGAPSRTWATSTRANSPPCSAAWRCSRTEPCACRTSSRRSGRAGRRPLGDGHAGRCPPGRAGHGHARAGRQDAHAARPRACRRHARDLPHRSAAVADGCRQPRHAAGRASASRPRREPSMRLVVQLEPGAARPQPEAITPLRAW